MIYVLGVVIAILAVDIVRMRGRARALAVLAPSDAPATHRAIGEIDPATLRAASAYMRANHVDLLDIVPRDLPALRALAVLQLVDLAKYRESRLVPGWTCAHALVVTEDVAERARPSTPANELEMTRLARRLKAFGKADFAIAPAEHARPAELSQRLALYQLAFGPGTPFTLAFLVGVWAIIGAGIALHPIAGLVAAGLWTLQPLLALAGTPLRSRGVVLVSVFRAPVEIYTLVRTLFGPNGNAAAAAAARPAYAELLASGTERFFEPRRETCPLCESRQLVVDRRIGDLFQHKPGTFALERCRGCGHVFQNPRLSLAGLDFYYKDFYDGLGEAKMEMIFGFGAQPYIDRALMVRSLGEAKRWLDVGAGHGHLCQAVREAFPGTELDGLDMSESIDEAKRRGWVDTAYRGLFPELAPTFAGRYDAVTMSHYLEHTRDPRAEIAAARAALAPNGALLIEVPDPEFALGKLFGRWWLPWFQPQHQHFVSVANLDKLLREHGFEPVEWHRGKAHQRVDFFSATWLFLDRIAPERRLPWRWRGGAAGAWRLAALVVGAAPLALCALLDSALAPVFRRARISNTYRVVARKKD